MLVDVVGAIVGGPVSRPERVVGVTLGTGIVVVSGAVTIGEGVERTIIVTGVSVPRTGTAIGATTGAATGAVMGAAIGAATGTGSSAGAREGMTTARPGATVEVAGIALGDSLGELASGGAMGAVLLGSGVIGNTDAGVCCIVGCGIDSKVGGEESGG